MELRDKNVRPKEGKKGNGLYQILAACIFVCIYFFFLKYLYHRVKSKIHSSIKRMYYSHVIKYACNTTSREPYVPYLHRRDEYI